MLRLFGLFKSTNPARLLEKGASVVDVRTVHEYDQGRMKGSINIPLDRIPANIERLRHLPSPILFCSAGDSRSGQAARFVRRNGIEAFNGGHWEKLHRLKHSH